MNSKGGEIATSRTITTSGRSAVYGYDHLVIYSEWFRRMSSNSELVDLVQALRHMTGHPDILPGQYLLLARWIWDVALYLVHILSIAS
jgi:hypothetical protein